MELWPNKDLNDLYKDYLKDAEVRPPESIWERIEAELPKRSPFYLWTNRMAWFGGLVLILGSLVISFQLSNNSNQLRFADNTSMDSGFDNKESLVLSQWLEEKDAEPRTNNQELTTKNQEPRIRNQESRTNGLESVRNSVNHRYLNDQSRTINQEPLMNSEQRTINNQQPTISKEQLRTTNINKKLNVREIIKREHSEFTELELELKNGHTLLAGNMTLNNQSGYVPEPFYDDGSTYLDLEDDLAVQNVVSIGEVDPKEKIEQAKKQVFRDLSLTTGFYIAPMFGSNATWMVKAPVEDVEVFNAPSYAMKFGKKVGIITGYDFNTTIGVETGLMWSDGGYILKRNVYGLGPEGVLKLNYVEAPLLFKYKMAKVADFSSKPMVVNYKVGMKYGYLVKGEVDNRSEEAVSLSLHRHKWGLVAGLDVDIYVARTMYMTFGTMFDVQADARYFPKYRNTKDSPITMNWSLHARLNLRSPKK